MKTVKKLLVVNRVNGCVKMVKKLPVVNRVNGRAQIKETQSGHSPLIARRHCVFLEYQFRWNITASLPIVSVLKGRY